MYCNLRILCTSWSSLFLLLLLHGIFIIISILFAIKLSGREKGVVGAAAAVAAKSFVVSNGTTATTNRETERELSIVELYTFLHHHPPPPHPPLCTEMDRNGTRRE